MGKTVRFLEKYIALVFLAVILACCLDGAAKAAAQEMESTLRESLRDTENPRDAGNEENPENGKAPENGNDSGNEEELGKRP